MRHLAGQRSAGSCPCSEASPYGASQRSPCQRIWHRKKIARAIFDGSVESRLSKSTPGHDIARTCLAVDGLLGAISICSAWADYSCSMGRLVLAENVVQPTPLRNMDRVGPYAVTAWLVSGKVCRSMSATCKRRPAAAYVAMDPAGPATTATSKISTDGACHHGIQRFTRTVQAELVWTATSPFSDVSQHPHVAGRRESRSTTLHAQDRRASSRGTLRWVGGCR